MGVDGFFKLGEFGNSIILVQEQISEENILEMQKTIRYFMKTEYIPPELKTLEKMPKISTAIDIFQLGILIDQLLAPGIAQGISYSPSIFFLKENMQNKNPDCRPNIREILREITRMKSFAPLGELADLNIISAAASSKDFHAYTEKVILKSKGTSTKYFFIIRKKC